MGPAPSQSWREQLAAWAIPDHILAAAAAASRRAGHPVESPWTLPTDLFARRADRQIAEPGGRSFELARAALIPAGTVLDVGAGAGAASLPLAPWCTGLTAVDTAEGMLVALERRATGLGLTHQRVLGRWPEIADSVPAADVVVCHHVAYNVPDLGAFALALDRHARRRVVLELSEGHPLRVLNPLWTTLHGLERPTGPTAADALAVLREAGLRPDLERWPRPPRPEYDSFDALVAVTRRRLCLPPERDAELAAALLALGADPEHPRDLAPADESLVTIWWDHAQ